MKILDPAKLVSIPVWQLILVFGLIFGFVFGLGFGLHWAFSLSPYAGMIASILVFSFITWLSEEK